MSSTSGSERSLRPPPPQSASFLQLSDVITDGFRIQIQNDPAVDARVKGGLAVWVVGSTNVEWVTGTPPPAGFPAQQNLLNDYAAAATALQDVLGPGDLNVGAPSAALVRDYLGEQFTASVDTTTVGSVSEFLPDIEIGDSVVYDFVGRARYLNQDATFTPQAVPTPVPEPSTLILLGPGCAALALCAGLRRRRGGNLSRELWDRVADGEARVSGREVRCRWPTRSSA